MGKFCLFLTAPPHYSGRVLLFHIFSSPGQSPGRAIALPPVSASTFTLKIFKNSYFPNYTMDFVHIWYDDRYSSKVLFSNTLPMPVTLRSQT